MYKIHMNMTGPFIRLDKYCCDFYIRVSTGFYWKKIKITVIISLDSNFDNIVIFRHLHY